MLNYWLGFASCVLLVIIIGLVIAWRAAIAAPTQDDDE